MTTLVEDFSSIVTQTSSTNESISDDKDNTRDLCGNPSEPFKCEICNKLFISSSFLVCHTDIYHKDKEEVNKVENVEVSDVILNEESPPDGEVINEFKEEHSPDREKINGAKDEKPKFHSSSYCDEDSVNSEVQLDKIQEDQSNTRKAIDKAENVCSEEQFFEVGENQELNEENKDLEEHSVCDIEMHKCEFCEKLFISEDCLLIHKKQHSFSSSDKHKCTHCIFSAKSHSKLLSHLATHQDYKEDKELFRCLECGKNFKEEVRLRQHQKFHANFQLVKCSLCDSMFRKGSGLATHMRAHLKSIPSSQSCENVKLNRQEIIVRKINNAGDKRFHCSVCDKGFTSTNNLMKHYIAKHDPNNPNIASTSFKMQKQDDEKEEVLSTDTYACEKCGRLFTSLKMLEGHKKKIHRNETENQRFRCPHCKYSTNKTRDLRNHVAVHTNERPHQCNLCGKGFTEQSSLRKHAFTHTGEKPYVCDVCGKKFTQRAHLKVHMRIHNKEKPYRCPYCEKTFAYHNVLIRHQRSHTGERPYKCTLCSKSFKSNTALQSHEIAQHTHEYPFNCTECGKGFIQFGNMQVHLRNIHNIAIYKLNEDNS
ncbi:zinc finger protein 883-like [Limulus polyphemus]|uniref:Zinc finger protein 883-like n=1 Tax=Limulus polyphemus TaxID=6850 RepID=A0ABM1BJF6_LIMPO|nr:zinc finger protein 883-like [Limulus polyphemus]XP_022251290.1 zinc finger protein 883-like [Limulus polyphemus]XP_022251291.1 zinc finger protein 883-like [Limulus polyphemus]XP_022251292.1 zinc finger protein 883-like [Limulus polyphemus]